MRIIFHHYSQYTYREECRLQVYKFTQMKEINFLAALKKRKGMDFVSYEKQFFLQNIIKKKIAHIGATNQNII